jgi:hypothetical protein
VTRPAPPRFASWLLQRFAFGPQRESLIGDIVEQYEQGRSSTWYRRQVLVTVFIGATTLVRAHPGRAFRALVLAITAPWFFATAASLLLHGILSHGWLTALFNISLLAYCSAGLAGLLLTITRVDEPPSLSLVESTRA